MSRPKVIQIAVNPGWDGPEYSGCPYLYVLYDNGEVWRRRTDDKDAQWRYVETPDDEAAGPME